MASEYPTAKRTLKEVKTYSSGPAALLSASSENRVWGGVTSGCARKCTPRTRTCSSPAALILALALIGLRCGVYTRRLRVGLLVGIVVCSVLAMGLGLTGAGYPYRLLFDYAPGWDGVRVPGQDLHARDAVLRAARRRGRAAGCGAGPSSWARPRSLPA